MIVALPELSAETWPCWSTVAIVELLDDQLISRVVRTRPPVSSTVGMSVRVWPAARLVVVGLSTTYQAHEEMIDVEPVRPDPNALVYALADDGRSAQEIATQLGRPKGEIELILALRREQR